MADAPPLALPDPIDAATLPSLDEADLDVIVTELHLSERQVIAAMAPHERQLRELRARLGEIATERRKRERTALAARRRTVREQGRSGEMANLAEALAAPTSELDEALPLAELPVFLASGGHCRLGFPGRPGPTAFSNGRQTQQASTWGEARRLYAEGWELGSAQLPGVRIHLAGTKVERVVAAAEVLVASGEAIPEPS